MIRVLPFLILSILPILSCSTVSPDPLPAEMDFREEMRRLVMTLSSYGKAWKGGFIVIPQNGQELLTADGLPGGPLRTDYARAIDGTGREDLFYGYSGDNRETPGDALSWMLPFLIAAEESGVEVLTTDYCSSPDKMERSYKENGRNGFISFAADRRVLDGIPRFPETPWNGGGGDVSSLKDARNFLYLINPSAFGTKEDFLKALESTDYDLVIVDLFDNEGEILSPGDVSRLQVKPDGSRRLVIAYMSIGEAEDYRWYWNPLWKKDPPSWLDGENRQWKGNYKVRYWEESWKSLLMGDRGSYLDLILSAGFDGVYLDLIDAFDYWENY